MLYLNDVQKKVIKTINKALLQVIIDGYKFLLEYLGTYSTKISIKGFILSGAKVTAEWIWVAGKAADWFEHGWFYGVLCPSNVTPRLHEQLFSFFQRAQNVICLTRPQASLNIFKRSRNGCGRL